MGGASAQSKLEKREKEDSYSVIAYLGREVPEAYLSYVYAKWLRGLRHGNDYFKLTEPSSYFLYYQKYIKMLMERPGTVVRLAVLTEDPDVVFGFSVSRGNILDYVHVHQDVRKRGIGKALANFEFEYITHLTRVGMTIWGAKFPAVLFDPFI